MIEARLLQVADIKRANGLLSDSAMFAKDKLLIPTQAMPPMGSAAPLCACLQSQSPYLYIQFPGEWGGQHVQSRGWHAMGCQTHVIL